MQQDQTGLPMPMEVTEALVKTTTLQAARLHMQEEAVVDLALHRLRSLDPEERVGQAEAVAAQVMVFQR
jgi:Zn-dependent oligopeptidase